MRSMACVEWRGDGAISKADREGHSGPDRTAQGAPERASPVTAGCHRQAVEAHWGALRGALRGNRGSPVAPSPRQTPATRGQAQTAARRLTVARADERALL